MSCGPAKSTSLPIDAPSPTPMLALDAEGWSSLKIESGFAETRLDSLGHFEITRNACWTNGSGALNLGEWNKLAEQLNQMTRLQIPLGPESPCVPIGLTPRALDGNIEVRLTDGSAKKWMEARGREICIGLPAEQRDLALTLARSIDRLLLQAFSEDCTQAP